MSARVNLNIKTSKGVKTIRAIHASGAQEQGLALRWNYNTGWCAQSHLVRKGSAHGGSGLFLRFNNIVYEVRPEATDSNRLYDDCGAVFDLTNDIRTAPDGWLFNTTRGIKELDDWLEIDAAKPFTVAFKVKGTSSTGTDGPSAILALSNNGWVIGQDPDLGEVFYFGMRSNGRLFFRDYFSTVYFDGGLTDWRDFKITFYPQNSFVHNAEFDCDVRQLNFTATCNGVTKTGTTYYTDTDDSHSYDLHVSRVVSYRTAKGESEFWKGFYGYIKYISISQDELGYSDYRRDTHKLAIYFD